MGGIGLAWGSIALVNGLVNGLSSFVGLIFSVLMILVGGYYSQVPQLITQVIDLLSCQPVKMPQQVSLGTGFGCF